MDLAFSNSLHNIIAKQKTEKATADRALAVCEAALEWFVARVCRPEDFSDTVQLTLEQGEKIVAQREQETANQE